MKTDLPNYQQLLSLTEQYSLETYTLPYWSGNIVYQESFLPLEQNQKEIVVSLMYPIDQVISLRSSDLKTVYRPNVDYKVEDGKIVIPKGSKVEAMSYEEYYPTQEISGKVFRKTGSGYISFSEGPFFHSKQYAVTYTHQGRWDGPTPVCKGKTLPQITKKLEEKKEINLVFYGDSITEGANSSGFIKSAPYAPMYTEMFADYLEKEYGCKIHLKNTAVGGKDSEWGVWETPERLASQNPDLAVIAFGMNDGSSKADPEYYRDNINEIIEITLETNPNCEFILIAPMLPNPEAVDFVGNQSLYCKELLQLERQGLAVADITSVYQYILTKKDYRDITGNNVNHPNDFIARLYTQLLINTIRT